MSDAQDRFRVIEGGGEPELPPGPNEPYEAWRVEAACDDPEAPATRLYANYRALHPSSGSGRDGYYRSFARAYARRLARDADAADRSELVELLDDVGIRDRYETAHVIWDDARPRQMHLWPDGNHWGRTPPLKPWRGEPGAWTYTVCGHEVDTHFLHQRAHRGEWARYYDDFEVMRAVHLARAAGEPEPPYTYGHERDARRICPGCAVATADFPECGERDKQDGPPDWWFAGLLTETADTMSQYLGDKPVATLQRLGDVAAKAYRAAAANWLAGRLYRDGAAALRRLFGTDLRDLGRWTPGRAIVTEYDELAALTRRLARRNPHELLDEKEWVRLIKPYLPGTPARDMTDKDFSERPSQRLRADVRERIEGNARTAKARR